MVDEAPPLNHHSERSFRSHPLVVILLRLLILGIGASAAAIVGVVAAMWRPDLIWQPNYSSLTAQKQQFTLSADALFVADKETILPEGYKLLDQIAAQLPLTQGRSVRIAGHSDLHEIAETDNSLNLSHQRAKAVADYLMSLRGEQSYHWIVMGYGASRPLAPNNSAANRKTNRRIEIIVSDF